MVTVSSGFWMIPAPSPSWPTSLTTLPQSSLPSSWPFGVISIDQGQSTICTLQLTCTNLKSWALQCLYSHVISGILEAEASCYFLGMGFEGIWSGGRTTSRIWGSSQDISNQSCNTGAGALSFFLDESGTDAGCEFHCLSPSVHRCIRGSGYHRLSTRHDESHLLNWRQLPWIHQEQCQNYSFSLSSNHQSYHRCLSPQCT